MADNKERFPVRGWYEDENLTVRQFFDTIDRFTQQEYEYHEISFTHDVYIGEALIGEAGSVEEAGPGLTIGFLCLFVRIPSYGIIDSRLTLIRKAT